MNVGPAGSPFTASLSRGLWFTAPGNFLITSLNVPGTGNQNIQVVRFTAGPPPNFSGSTTAHTTLFSTVNNSSAGAITVSIPVANGDIIGILGTRGPSGGSVTSPYGTSSTFTTTIDGNSVVLRRLLFQSSTLPAGALSSEAAGSYSRVELTYEPVVPLNVGTQVTTFGSNYRGFWFTAPVGVVITGLQVPTSAGSGNQNIQVVRFAAGGPPNFGASTSAHTTLYSTINDSTSGFIPVSIAVSPGDTLGILGARGTNGGTLSVSYGPSPSPLGSTMGGLAVNLNRLVYQSGSLPAGNLSSEPAGNVGRIEMLYAITSAGPSNQAPNAVLSGASGNEGSAIVANGAGSTDDGTIVAWDVDCDNNGSYETTSTSAAGASCTFTDNGTFTVGLRVTDDGGLTDTDTASFPVANVAPTVTASIPAAGNEGDSVSMSGSFSDVGTGDTHTFSWDFGDGGSDSSTLTPTHTYASPGAYTVVLTVTDDDGGAGSASGTVVVNNLVPVTNAGSDQSGNEGQTLAFNGSFTDPGTGHTILWSFGDGASTTGTLTPTHVYADDGTFTVSLSVTDPGGLTDTDTLFVTLANLPPSITSSAGLSAIEESTYSYAAAAVDPGTADVLSWSKSSSSPSWLSVVAGTGVVSGVPPLGSAGTHEVTLNVTDGDGGTDSQTFVLVVDSLDSDSDGMPDSWEIANGLDVNDAEDAAEDPDMDGVSNLDEFLGDSDPNGFDGPSAPTLIAPVDGVEVTMRPLLEIGAAADPQSDELTYTVEIYDDVAMTTLVETIDDIHEASIASVQAAPLFENSGYAWRARAEDGWVGGPWTELGEFFVNETNEPPHTPTLLYPVDETVDRVRPEFEFTPFEDVDRDAGLFLMEVEDAEGTLVASAELSSEARDTATLNVDLVEDSDYRWRLQPVDEHGLEGQWTDWASFFVDTDNAAPTAVEFISPEDGAEVTRTPRLEATEAVDPEGDAITYMFEIDTSSGFDSGDLIARSAPPTGTGSVVWDLGDSGDELAVGDWFARVRAVDARDAGSAWDTITFVVPLDDLPSPTAELGCGSCGSTLLAPADPRSAWLLLPLLLLRRRRREGCWDPAAPGSAHLSVRLSKPAER
jgi:PKD repeat protein